MDVLVALPLFIRRILARTVGIDGLERNGSGVPRIKNLGIQLYVVGRRSRRKDTHFRLDPIVFFRRPGRIGIRNERKKLKKAPDCRRDKEEPVTAEQKGKRRDGHQRN